MAGDGGVGRGPMGGGGGMGRGRLWWVAVNQAFFCGKRHTSDVLVLKKKTFFICVQYIICQFSNVVTYIQLLHEKQVNHKYIIHCSKTIVL